MLIGISGRLGSGKDTFALQLIKAMLIAEYPNAIGLPNIMINNMSGVNGIEIHKFADALKDIVCRLTGCTRENLEDPEFKNSVMGEEWWENKDAISKRMFPHWKGTLIDGDEMWKPTYREFLQKLGTDVLRNWMPNIHVNATFATWKMRQTQVSGEHWAGHAITMGTTSEPQWPKWIITDVRFPNEAQAIKDRGGILLRMERYPDITVNRGRGTSTTEKYDPNNLQHVELYKAESSRLHFSETALDNYIGFDVVIDNNGTIEELYQQAINIVKQFKLS